MSTMENMRWIAPGENPIPVGATEVEVDADFGQGRLPDGSGMFFLLKEYDDPEFMDWWYYYEQPVNFPGPETLGDPITLVVPTGQTLPQEIIDLIAPATYDAYGNIVAMTELLEITPASVKAQYTETLIKTVTWELDASGAVTNPIETFRNLEMEDMFDWLEDELGAITLPLEELTFDEVYDIFDGALEEEGNAEPTLSDDSSEWEVFYDEAVRYPDTVIIA